MPRCVAFDLGLHCLQMSLLWDTRLKWVKNENQSTLSLAYEISESMIKSRQNLFDLWKTRSIADMIKGRYRFAPSGTSPYRNSTAEKQTVCCLLTDSWGTTKYRMFCQTEDVFIITAKMHDTLVLYTHTPESTILFDTI